MGIVVCKKRYLWGSALILLLEVSVGCVTRAPVPVEEYVLARTAIQHSFDAGAPKFSPGYWHEAEDYFQKAKKLLKEGYNAKARKSFYRARIMAEKAENSTRLEKFRSGGEF